MREIIYLFIWKKSNLVLLYKLNLCYSVRVGDDQNIIIFVFIITSKLLPKYKCIQKR